MSESHQTIPAAASRQPPGTVTAAAGVHGTVEGTAAAVAMGFEGEFAAAAGSTSAAAVVAGTAAGAAPSCPTAPGSDPSAAGPSALASSLRRAASSSELRWKP